MNKVINSLLSLVYPVSATDNKIKVACVGDSITEGQELGKNTYPHQLQGLLGNSYIVKNFGVSGRTLLKKGDFPYWNERRFKQAQAFEPDIIIILLGTNDSKPQNWQYKDEFYQNYCAFIQVWKELSSQPIIYICYPIPVFQDAWGITTNIVKNEIIPIISQIAQDENLEIIDLYKALTSQSELVPDGVHPNQKGAGLIAQAVYEQIQNAKIRK